MNLALRCRQNIKSVKLICTIAVRNEHVLLRRIIRELLDVQLRGIKRLPGERRAGSVPGFSQEIRSLL